MLGRALLQTFNWRSMSFLLSAIISAPASADTLTGAFFQGLGDLPGLAYDSVAQAVSADGSVIVGLSTSSQGVQAFRWQGGTMTGLGYLPGGFHSEAYGVSADGSVVVGFSAVAGGYLQAFRWEGGVMTSLGSLHPTQPSSCAYGVAANGDVIVGWTNSIPGHQAYRWENGVMTGLGDLPGGQFYSTAKAVSADGTVVVGLAYPDANNRPVRWIGGEITLLSDRMGYALAASADGSVIVGTRADDAGHGEAFRWENGVAVGLGQLPGDHPGSEGLGVSGDGSVVVGRGLYPSAAFIWDAPHGMRDLRSVLVNDFGLDLTGWTLAEAAAVSADGMTIVGRGWNPGGNQEAWMARIPEPTALLMLALAGAPAVCRRRSRSP